MRLAIESSCDESAVALFDPARGILGHWIHSQVADHEPYGGVVPDLAVRAHLQKLPELVRMAQREPWWDTPAEVAVTVGPGLAGCLALGLALGRSLAESWRVPLVGVNHLRGHAFSPFIGLHADAPDRFLERLRDALPHLGLIVSGGNTLLFRVETDGSLAVVAETVDDAAGEALDKGAKLLGLGYPGGPAVEERARAGTAGAFDFPRAFLRSGEMRFSFSGLKTSLRYRLEAMDDATFAASLPDLCASYQQAVVDALVGKTAQILRRRRDIRSLGLSGGVANNGRLREAMQGLADGHDRPLLVASPEHTGDNAAMIAFAAWADPAGVRRFRDETFDVDPSWRLA